MRVTHITLIATLAVAAALAAQPPTMRNIGYLALGYNIYKGDPKNTQGGSDPGFTPAPIFNFTYTQDKTTADGRYTIPDRVDVVNDNGCYLEFHSTTITGETSTTKSFEQDIEAGVKGFGAAFKASTQYKSMSETLKESKKVYTASQGTCKVYRAALEEYLLPDLSENFVTGVKALPAEYDRDEYMRFFNTFGTHYVTGTKMGSKFGYFGLLQREKYQTMQKYGMDVEVTASLGAFGIAGSTKTLTDREQKEVNLFQASLEHSYQFTVGSRPPKDGQSVTWAQQSVEEPMPIQYALRDILDLIEPLLPQYFSNPDVYAQNLERAQGEYCAYLRDELQVIGSCEDPSPDPQPPSPPPTVNECRLCARQCGGGYAADGGGVAVDANWPDWSLLFGQMCQGAYQSQGDATNIRLCCQRDSAATKSYGECRICASCGGDFGAYGGSLMTDANWPDWINAYDTQCNGYATQRPNPGGGFSVCCKNSAPAEDVPDRRQICSLCVTCGGEYPVETGDLSRDKHWKDFFTELGEQCWGQYAHNSYNKKDGVRLCCRQQTTPINPFDFVPDGEQ